MDEIRSEKVLKQMQALPLDMKEAISRNRIFEWVERQLRTRKKWR